MLYLLFIICLVVSACSSYPFFHQKVEIESYCYTKANKKFPSHDGVAFDCYKAKYRKPMRVEPLPTVPAEDLQKFYECDQLLPVNIEVDNYFHERYIYANACIKSLFEKSGFD